MSAQACSAARNARGAHLRVAQRVAPAQTITSLGETVRYRRGDAICHQGDRAANWYSISAGVATQYVIRPDGRRQMMDLLLPGDFFGFTRHDHYAFTADAAVDGTVVIKYPMKRIEGIVDLPGDLSRDVRNAMIEALTRLEAHMLVMGRITASEKVASFLLEIERRLAQHSSGILLPVSRYDIADYLAISVETVSRALGDLKQRGRIRLTGPRAVDIVDRRALVAGEEDYQAPPLG